MSLRAAFVTGCFVLVVLASMRPSRADDASKPDSSGGSVELNITATVLLPDGRAAAGAVVRSFDNFDDTQRTATADAQGRFTLPDSCLSGLKLHVTSPDARNQAVLTVPQESARSFLARPLTIVLKPARPHQVVVTANGQPVAGAHVSLATTSFGFVSLVEGLTGAEGTAPVWFPAGETIDGAVAWHPQHGVNGIDNRGSARENMKLEFALLPRRRHVVRVLDSEGHPVAGRTIAASMSVGETWISAKQIEATRATTAENGEVQWDWFPPCAKYIDVDLFDGGWKIDKIDNEKTPEGLTTVHVRKKFPVEGRLILPGGVDAEGILVTGFGFGPGPSGDIPRARTRRDGSFTMLVPAGHGYVLSVHDLEWTSNTFRL